MAIPEQIRKQSEAIKALYEPTTPAAPEGDVVTDPIVVTPVVTEVTPPADSTVPAQQQTSQEGGQPTSEESSETYQQRYRTLQGMYNSEVPRLQSQTREQAQRLQQLEQLIASLSAAPSEPEPQQSQPTPLLSDTERSEYGESIDVMRKVSREEVGDLVARIGTLENMLNQMAGSLNTHVIPQVQHVAQQQSLTQEDRFWSQLTDKVPSWKQINNDPDFHTWLLEVDPLTGTARQSHLVEAQGRFDVNRVMAFFDTWSKVSGKYTNATATPNRSAQATELERQVAPGRSRSTSAPTGQASKTYTRADIARFFDEVRQGKYKGRDAERNRTERDIFAAQADGRLTA